MRARVHIRADLLPYTTIGLKSALEHTGLFWLKHKGVLFSPTCKECPPQVCGGSAKSQQIGVKPGEKQLSKQLYLLISSMGSWHGPSLGVWITTVCMEYTTIIGMGQLWAFCMCYAHNKQIVCTSRCLNSRQLFLCRAETAKVLVTSTLWTSTDEVSQNMKDLLPQ
jgi:hypothetical protein